MTGKSSHADAPRRGVQGIDVFAIAGDSISGFVYSHKTGLQDCVRQAYTTLHEQYLALYLEYHPHVRSYQRGDTTPECAKRYELPTPLGTPYPIPYDWDGERHTYLPDFVGTLVDGSLFIAEAGLRAPKLGGQELAKVDAALRYARQRGGEFWISTETLSTDPNNPAMLYENFTFLHARRADFATYAVICKALERCWPYGRLRTPRDVIAELGPLWSESEVEGAIWKRVGDAAATGHLLFDLANHWLTLDALFAPQDPHMEPILLPPLPSQLDGVDNDDTASAYARDRTGMESRDAEKNSEYLNDAPLVDGEPGSSIDPTSIESEKERQRFERLRSAVYEVANGKDARSTARTYLVERKNLGRLVKRWHEFGDIALLSHGVHLGTARMHPEIEACITKLYKSRQQLTYVQILEHPKLKRQVDELSAKGVAVRMPSYRQICLLCERLEPVKDLTLSSGKLRGCQALASLTPPTSVTKNGPSSRPI